MFLNNSRTLPYKTLPDIAYYRGSANNPWNLIPLGLQIAETSKGHQVLQEFRLDIEESSLTVFGGHSKGRESLVRILRNHCIQHPERWCLLDINVSSDFEEDTVQNLGEYHTPIMYTLTNAEEALESLRKVEAEMGSRLQQMQRHKVESFRRIPGVEDLAVMVVIEELHILLNSFSKTRQEEFTAILLKILEHGNAAGIFMAVFFESLNEDTEKIIQSVHSKLMLTVPECENDETPMCSTSGKAIIEQEGHAPEAVQLYYSPKKWAEKYVNGDNSWLQEWNEYVALKCS